MGKSFSLEKLFVCTLFLIALTDQGSTRASSRQSSIGEEASDDGGNYGGRVVHELKQTQQERTNNSQLSEKKQEHMQGNKTHFGSLDDDEVNALRNLSSGLGIKNVDVNASFCTSYGSTDQFSPDDTNPYLRDVTIPLSRTLFSPTPDTMFDCSFDNGTGSWHITLISLIGDGNTVKNEAEGVNVDTAPPYLLDDISSFTHLKTLLLQNIPLTASVFPNLIKLYELQELVLRKNGLAGSIPSELDILKNLESLDLSQNNLEGPIPPTLGNLSMLTELKIAENQLSGSIPSSLGDLFNLTKLDLRKNQLTGEIPENFKKLSNLEYLWLAWNYINGSASYFGNLSSLLRLDLYQNSFSGEIPPVGKLVSLKELILGNNLFNGSISAELGELTNLTFIYISGNILSGPLPDFSKLTLVTVFVADGNYLTGPIPDYIASWKSLVSLTLLGNNFTSIPVGIFNLPRLETLWISDVQITSPFKIPANASLPIIQNLILRNCSIGGYIPASIGRWTYLRILDLSFNKLEGEIPDSLNDTRLTELYLTGNNLGGSIPDWISKKIEITNKTDLSFNNFIEQGLNHNKQEMNLTDLPINLINEQTIKYLSRELCKHRATNRKSAINSGGAAVHYEGTVYEADESMAQYSLSESKIWAYICSGAFTSNVYNSSAYIKSLTCSANILDEPLHKRARLCPAELTYYGFCFTKGSYTVKLYFAEIVYANTFDYSILNRRIFDVYVQDKRILQDFNIKDIAGGPNKPFIFTYKDAKVKDDNLLKISFVWKGKGASINYGDGFNGPLISAISVTPKYPLTKIQTAAVTFVTIISLVLVFAFLWRTGVIGDRNMRIKVIKLHGKPYSLKQLLAATRNFSDKKVIGKGLFGTVYQADFPNPDQKVYVVKKLHLEFMEKQGGQLRQEFFTLQRLDNENIVPLLDGYWKGDRTLLIYEYMKGGSLETALFGESSVSILRNNWEARLNVCKDIVKGLKYLHEDSTFQITHGDIKANNVLLDGSDPPTAKLSDFGLAKFYEEENPFSVTKDKREMQLIAPGQVSTIPTIKADVYSFGMLLLEIISGRRAFETNDKGEAEYLLPKATQLFRDHKAEELVDIKLRIEDRKQAASLVELALKCADVVPDQRPTMSQVLAALEYLKTGRNYFQASTSWGNCLRKHLQKWRVWF